MASRRHRLGRIARGGAAAVLATLLCAARALALCRGHHADRRQCRDLGARADRPAEGLDHRARRYRQARRRHAGRARRLAEGRAACSSVSPGRGSSRAATSCCPSPCAAAAARSAARCPGARRSRLRRSRRRVRSAGSPCPRTCGQPAGAGRSHRGLRRGGVGDGSPTARRSSPPQRGTRLDRAVPRDGELGLVEPPALRPVRGDASPRRRLAPSKVALSTGDKGASFEATPQPASAPPPPRRASPDPDARRLRPAHRRRRLAPPPIAPDKLDTTVPGPRPSARLLRAVGRRARAQPRHRQDRADAARP